MFLILIAILMRFADIPKFQHNQRSDNRNKKCSACKCENNNFHSQIQLKSCKSSESKRYSCLNMVSDNTSYKENYVAGKAIQSTLRNGIDENIMPKHLQQFRYYENIQQQQLMLLQQQLIQRRHLQKDLREQGVFVVDSINNGVKHIPAKPTLTCNQEYLLEIGLESQKLQNYIKAKNNYCEKDVMANNYFNLCATQNDSNGKGQTFLRGMTEISINNDTSEKSHFSQPLQNSPNHSFSNHTLDFFPSQHCVNKNNTRNKYIISNNQEQTQHNQNYQQQNQKQLLINTFANRDNINVSTNALTSSSSATHYKNPLNCPNYLQFVYNQHQPNLPLNSTNSTSLYHLRLNNSLPQAAQTQYQQHLNDRLFQQQHLQQQQNNLLNSEYFEDNADYEISEESLKQNVAIVLNNLDRYNSTLRSIILNEQVCSNSSPFSDDSFLINNNVSGNNNNVFPSAVNTNLMAMTTTATPESDYNSNATTPASRSNSSLLPAESSLYQLQQGVGYTACGTGCIGSGVALNNTNMGVGSERLVTIGNNLNCSIASSHDFTHDNSDYQWFLDYGYRDGCSGIQRSVLSSLSGSAIGDVIYYDDLAKNIDANLAEVDMESFRAEDIHTLLSHLPEYCKSLGSVNNRLQQSLLMQQQHRVASTTVNGSEASVQFISQTSTSSMNEIDNSLCKSELLFSPVKESHISVDSLDMEAFPDDSDIILTCKANKDNYTIAFEGSVLYSDESFYVEPHEIGAKEQQNFVNLHSNLDDIVRRKPFEVSMSHSENALQPANPVINRNTFTLQRYPSGNNNTANMVTVTNNLPQIPVRKSCSLPNLNEINGKSTLRKGRNQENVYLEQPLNVSQAINVLNMGSCNSRNLLPMCQIPISVSASMSERGQAESHVLSPQLQRYKYRCSCNNASTAATINNVNINTIASMQQKNSHISGSASSGNSNPPAFNLVKMFIKQKINNCSTEAAQASSHTCLDVSSGCWPSSEAASSSSSSTVEQHLHKKNMIDSGKGSGGSRHEDDLKFRPENKIDNLKIKKGLRTLSCKENISSSSTSTFSEETSPEQGRRSVPIRNPHLNQIVSNSQHSYDSSRSNSEQITQLLHSSKTAIPKEPYDSKKERRKENNRRDSTHSNSEMITRSMQTSCSSLSSRGSLNERYRCVPPSFLAKLNNLGEERQAPIYVIYPNYALPDLGFVKADSNSDVILSPFKYQVTIGSSVSSSTNSSLKKRLNLSGHQDEILKTINYNHIVDWNSLITLLPQEYRRRLKHIPELEKIIKNIETDLVQRPLFCMSPPLRRNRPQHICDCAQYFQLNQTHIEDCGNSSSGSSHQPSSGYRGSSTLLTDSEFENGDPLKQMYIYQYEQQRMDSGIETSPAGNNKMPTQRLPRGILRKSSITNQDRSKRNSMTEAHQSKLSKLEKRRSLQEPPYNYAIGSAEELSEVFEEEFESEICSIPSSGNACLSRKDVDARTRAENFLSSLPRSELKYYAEIAAVLESSEEQVQYDAAALKKEVSRVLSQQKKVSFIDTEETLNGLTTQRPKQFSTPPNSPNISVAGNNGRIMAPSTVPRRIKVEDQEKRKIESNRFKRLQIQWELMSKESSMLKDLANTQSTKSGGSTPTSSNGAQTVQKSRIPRPVSYPAGKIHNSKSLTKISHIPKNTIKTENVSPLISRISSKDTSSSPSRIVPPKRYSVTSPISTAYSLSTGAQVTNRTSSRPRTANGRLTVTSTPSTPKHRVQSPRPISKIR